MLLGLRFVTGGPWLVLFRFIAGVFRVRVAPSIPLRLLGRDEIANEMIGAEHGCELVAVHDDQASMEGYADGRFPVQHLPFKVGNQVFVIAYKGQRGFPCLDADVGSLRCVENN